MLLEFEGALSYLQIFLNLERLLALWQLERELVILLLLCDLIDLDGVDVLGAGSA